MKEEVASWIEKIFKGVGILIVVTLIALGVLGLVIKFTE